jgi:3-oxocholest-4-en-26-oate---CoA ligase
MGDDSAHLVMCAAMEMHWATVWEAVADVLPDSPAVTNGDVTRTWAEYDQRAARVTAGLCAAGLQPQSKVALCLYNGNEYLEAQYAAFKMRGIAINVNYRYLDEELWYLLDNADAEALFFHASLADRVARVVDRLPKLRLLVEVDDTGSGDLLGGRAVAYEELVDANEPAARIARDESDLYMLYTGGTTGMPKGVMYPMGEFTRFFTLLGFPAVGLPIPETANQIAPLVAAHAAGAGTSVSVTGAPLMHGTGLWLGAMMHHLGGAHVVTLASRSLDADELLTAIQRHRCTHSTIVGDAFSKPIIRALDAAIARGQPYDTSSLRMIVSSGVMWTTEVKEALLDRIPQVALYDAMGSTEGSMGSQVTVRGAATETAKFNANPTTKVFDELDREVEPGSGQIGRVAAGGLVPIGYYKDPEKSARTFRVIDGVRYSFPGDMGQIAADGTLILLGRGSNVINSGGEKIFPEEVEEAVKRIDGVVDCLVVGIDDETFGQAVTAVAALAPGAAVSEDEVISGVKTQIAGFKAPKRVVFVAQVPRAPNGKADYKRARELASAT